MLEISNVRMPLDVGLPGVKGERAMRRSAAEALGLREDDVLEVRLLKRSVDARKKSDVHFVGMLAVCLKNERAEYKTAPGVNVKVHEPLSPLFIPSCSDQAAAAFAAGMPRPIVVGAGPAGLFAALYLAEAGLRPLVLERGADVDARIEAVDAFATGGPLDTATNIQFGEGGAGTFSDGKLNTGTKSPHIRHVLQAFVDAGAPEEILWQAKPHIGTDKLVDVVRNLRERIIAAGGEVRFCSQVTDFRFEDGALSAVEVRFAATRASAPATEATAANAAADTVEVIPARTLILACGHSARDTFETLHAASFAMERKPFAVGVRIEHPQSLINHSQYGDAASHPALGAADYKLATHLPDGRGVYTFCMCPGGEVVAAASEEGGVCVNGMSRYARAGANANSALLVEVRPDDLPGENVLEGVALQRQLEGLAFRVGGGNYCAPAQTVGDFLKGVSSAAAACARVATVAGAVGAGFAAAAGSAVPAGLAAAAGSAVPAGLAVVPTYPRGVTWCDLRDCLPPFVADSIAEALPLLDRKLRGFASPEAVMTAVEARSSSPVRIVRGADMQSVSHGGVYPCGEGAGYAGGITSAAVDGLRVAEAVVEQFIALSSR